MCCASNPGLTAISLPKLRNSKPAATSNTIANAISPAASRFRARRRLPLSPARPPPSRRLVCKLEFAANHAGARPNAMLATAESKTANPNTVLSTPIAFTLGTLSGSNELSACTPQYARPIPINPPSRPSTAVSLSNCRTIRVRPAPSVARTAISRAREVARVSSKFAMFAQAINNTSPTAPNSTSSAAFTFPPIILSGELLAEPGTDRVHLRLHLNHGDARLYSCNHAQPMSSPSLHPTAEQRILHQRNPQLLALCHLRKAKISPHDSHHRERALVQVDRTSDQVWICAKDLPPQAFADDCHRRRPPFPVLREKHSSGQRLLLQNGENLRRHDRSVHHRGLASPRQCELMKLASRHFTENVILFAYLHKV